MADPRVRHPYCADRENFGFEKVTHDTISSETAGDRHMYCWLKAAAVSLVLGLTLASTSTAAENAAIGTFFGSFKGGGIAENSDSLYFGVTVRDFDVEIGPSPTGFDVKWTAVIRGGGDPAKPNVRRKTLSLTFSPTNRASVFEVKKAEDPMSGEPFTWARIEDHTLTVYMLTIREVGGYEIQSYARTLTGQGMDLLYARVRDGDKVRTVKGKLVKYAE
jgi:hypothetical protein